MRDIPMKEREIFEDVSMVPARGGLAAALAPMASSDMPLSRDKPMLLKYADPSMRMMKMNAILIIQTLSQYFF